MNRLLLLTGDRSSDLPMKNKAKDQPVAMIAREVTHTIFGQENLSGTHQPLTRIALERCHVREIIPGVPETAGETDRRLNTPAAGTYK